ncbi:site-specific integrase [Natronosalvus amylolyticus]|uniref:tyrosine-type recombinase/integrase n=1 Tax=Natronosalvus amylolyticus TaxID=2961994 RepID=UPI0031BA06AB
MGWCTEQVPEAIVLPTRDGVARDSAIDPDRVASILDDLERYHYASIDHVLLALIWTCSMRISGVRTLDVKDVHHLDRWCNVAHRPDTGTPLKNKEKSEREVNLHGWVADILNAWINDRRPDVTDPHGREPLLGSNHGRLARSSIRRRIYALTACGGIDDGCTCEAKRNSKCNESVSPHDIRRSSISAWLDNGVDPSLLSQRVDTSQETMEQHYDIRSPSQKRKLRRDAFDM